MTSQRRIIFIICSFLVLQAFFYMIYRHQTKVQIIDEISAVCVKKSEEIKEPVVALPTPPVKKEQVNPVNYKFGFKSLVKEVSLDDLKVKGEIPNWLHGSLIFNGPAYLPNINENSGWFEGLAMLHLFNLDSNHVSYKNQFLKSKSFYDTFATNNPKVKHIKINNANINVAKIANKFVALSEIPLPVIFNPKTLKTIGSFTYHDKLPSDKIFESSNPIRDESKKETINFLIHMGALSSNYEIYKIKDDAFSLGLGDARREKIATITIKEPAYIHNLSITKNYIIFVEYPFVVKPYRLAMGGSMIDKFEWKPERGTNFYVINRNTKEVKTLNSKAFFAFSNVNAFEKNNKIIVDIVTFEDASIIKKMTTVMTRLNIKNYSPDIASKLSRFKLDLENKTVEEETLSKESINFPRINENYIARPYNFVYGTSMRVRDYYDDINQLSKININDKEEKYWDEDGCYPSEPVFVAAPNAQEEDDGVIMSVVLDGKKQTSFLLILNATSFKEIARVELPHHIPFGLRGNFFPSPVV
ncbi:MAG: carotenoid oxygenase family protein [Candidatus Babeliales bacterium]|nr:carotenoid oxygenase family protein [Candidatus Babeliales bacterium]